MKKIVVSFVMLLVSLNAGSQVKDTIKLDEIKIVSKNRKVKHIKTKGKSSSLKGNSIKSIISSINKIPCGKLSSIKFFFNSSVFFLIKDANKKEYKDVELGLLIYSAKQDSSPGELLTDKIIRFTLHPNDSGSVELNLRPLHITSSETMFFGIELYNKQIGNDFKIMTNCNEDNSKALYIKTCNDVYWHFSNIPCGMKMDIGILVEN